MLQQSLVVPPSGLESLPTWLGKAFQEGSLTELATSVREGLSLVIYQPLCLHPVYLYYG